MSGFEYKKKLVAFRQITEGPITDSNPSVRAWAPPGRI